jgi:uncharacterized lipoprotein
MNRLLIAASAILFLAACDSGGDQQNDPIDDNQTQNQTDGNTAPASRDPTPSSGTGNHNPMQSSTGTHQR